MSIYYFAKGRFPSSRVRCLKNVSWEQAPRPPFFSKIPIKKTILAHTYLSIGTYIYEINASGS